MRVEKQLPQKCSWLWVCTHNKCTNHTREQFYVEVTTILKQVKKNELIILMEAFNAKVGKGEDSETVGIYD